jgi:hypothetical protein
MALCVGLMADRVQKEAAVCADALVLAEAQANDLGTAGVCAFADERHLLDLGIASCLRDPLVCSPECGVVLAYSLGRSVHACTPEGDNLSAPVMREWRRFQDFPSKGRLILISRTQQLVQLRQEHRRRLGLF